MLKTFCIMHNLQKGIYKETQNHSEYSARSCDCLKLDNPLLSRFNLKFSEKVVALWKLLNNQK